MKRKNDIRHQKRVNLMQALFAQSFGNFAESENVKIFKKIGKLKTKIDPIIEEAAPQFPIEKIAKVDVAILRLAIYELIFEKKEPPKVIIDEAIEIAKEFGGEASPKFINGVLATIFNKYNKNG